jgi:hypothetical protein
VAGRAQGDRAGGVVGARHELNARELRRRAASAS